MITVTALTEIMLFQTETDNLDQKERYGFHCTQIDTLQRSPKGQYEAICQQTKNWSWKDLFYAQMCTSMELSTDKLKK